MKKIVLIVIATALAVGAFAQEPEIRRGYIGLSLGVAFPAGDIDGDAVSGGAQLNLVDFGYLFSQNVGIAATLFGTAFISKADSKSSLGMGGIMVGPLFSFASKSYKTEFDLKPMIGFANGTLISDGSTSSSKRDIALGLGAAMRINVGRKVSLTVGADYYYATPEDVDLSSFAIKIGVNFRLK